MLASVRDTASSTFRSLAEAGLLGASSRLPLGTNVFSQDWDVLVLLDTCRVDALRAVAPEFAFESDVESTWSVGSSTREWAANTFTERYRPTIENTAVVCGNGSVKRALDAESAMETGLAARVTSWETVPAETCRVFDCVPGYAPREPYGGLVTPDAVTDRAIAVGRDRDYDRLLVHYIAPHNPYRSGALAENRPILDHEYRPFDWLRAGGDRDVVWESYLDELRWVLESVRVLLRNVDADRVAVSADHGELFGSLGLYSHPTGVPHPALRRVPWLETTAVDTGAYEPHLVAPTDLGVSADVREQLARLGYR